MPILSSFTPLLKSTGSIVAMPGKPERADQISPFHFKSIGNVVGTNCIDYTISQGRPHALKIAFRTYRWRHLTYQVSKLSGMCQVMWASFNVVIGLALLPLGKYCVNCSS